MSYVKQVWADNDPAKPVSAARMNYIETGLDAVANGGSVPLVTSTLTRNGFGEIASYVQNGVTVTATRNAFGVIQTVSDGTTTRTVTRDGFGQITGVS